MFKHQFNVFAISETWTNESNQSLFVILGYNCIINNRTIYNGKCDGAGLFILDDLSFVDRTNLCAYATDNFECVLPRWAIPNLVRR